MFKNHKPNPASLLGKIADEIGKGLVAGFAGTVAITLSQMIEMKITKRKPGTAPADAAEKVLNIKPEAPEDKEQFSQEVHWAYGTSWGITRGLLSLLGLKGLPATALHFATVYGTALVMEPTLKVAPPLKKWSAKEILIDALHHAVYAVAAGLVYDAMSED